MRYRVVVTPTADAEAMEAFRWYAERSAARWCAGLDRALANLAEEASSDRTDMGSIGALRDDAERLDQAVEHAMKVREERPWRLGPGE